MRSILLAIIGSIVASSGAYAQKYAMLEMKQATETRWRFGQGISVGEPTGIQLSFYKAREICTFRKHLAIEIYASQEGVLLSNFLSKFDSSWSKGGVRVGANYIWFIPVKINNLSPFIGIGMEGGTRNLSGESSFSTDAIAKVGAEWNFKSIRWSRKTNLIPSFFMEGKFNYCITSDFKYFLPSAGIKLHWL